MESTPALGIADARPAVHLRELARQAGVTPSMMAKEMDTWLRAGLVDEQRDGNRRLFQARAASDVDLWVLGRCDYGALLAACAQAQQALGRPVNPVLYAPEELAEQVRADNVFVADVRQRPRIALIGSEDDIARALGQPAPKRPAHRARAHTG